MSAAGYPLVVPVTASTLTAWTDDELASFEDHGRPEHGHVRNVLERRRTRLVLESPAELELVIASAHHHAACWDDRYAYRSAMARLVERLRELEARPA